MITNKLHSFLYYPLVVFLVFIAGTVVLSALKIPGGLRIFTVSTGSMSPAISSGSLIITKPQKSYFAGDIITFQPDKYQDKTITHRIFNVLAKNEKNRFATKGDANDALDNNLITTDQIVGKVIVSIPFLGNVIVVAKSDIGKIFLITIPTAIIVCIETQKIIKEIRSV